MEAATLHCPDCGAPASPDARECGYCHARLATVACPNCFGLAFKGMRYCPSCGAELQRQVLPDTESKLVCPHCAGVLKPVRIGPTQLHECAGCGGAWVDHQTFAALCREWCRQAAALATPRPEYKVPVDVRVIYRHCPVCQTLMNRVNFEHSGTLVDVCSEHGTWFDAGELHRVEEFILAGGLFGVFHGYSSSPD